MCWERLNPEIFKMIWTNILMEIVIPGQIGPNEVSVSFGRF
jgi:hypothetical protein